MDTNVNIIIEIAKRITTKDPKSIYLYSGLLFEAEGKANKLNDMGTISAITWLCHESSYMNKLGYCYREKEVIESLVMVELSKL
ncbi:hypothetical protein ACWU4D_18395 [Vibrio sp. WJH972]